MADDRACLAGNASGSRSGSASLRDGGALLLKAVPCNIIIIMLNLVFFYYCFYNYQYCSLSLLLFHVIITYRIAVIILIILIIISAWIFIIALIAR